MTDRRPRGLVIAVDGPSGAGKSTITRLLAERLGYQHIDTGAMYRALALAVQRAGVATDDDQAVGRVCQGVSIAFLKKGDTCRVIANNEDVSAAIRTPEISRLTSLLSSREVVRSALLGLQRELGRDGGVILEGRDIGTVVFPDAEVKFFLTASVAERGRRRYLELRERGEEVSLATTIEEVARRDEQDQNRPIAPLRRAGDAVEIDSTGLPVEEVVERMLAVIAGRAAGAAGQGA